MVKHTDKLSTNILEYDKYYDKIKNHSRLFQEYRNLWDRASSFEVETSFPLQIEFELSNACNFRCGFCPYSFPKSKLPKGFDIEKKDKIMSYELFKKIIDEGSSKGLMAIELGYNTEPLIFKKLINCIRYAKKKNIIDIRMSTNGLKLTKDISALLIKSGLTHLNVSFDAFSEETFLKTRGSKEYKKVLQNSLDFLKIRNELGHQLPLMRVSFIVTKENKHEKNSFVKFWKGKADLIAVQSLVSYDNTPKSLQNLGNDKQKNVEYNCHQPWTRVAIRSNGDIKPCCSIPGMAFSKINLSDTTITNYWNSKEMKKLRNRLKVGEGYKNSVCKKCIESIENKNN